MAARIDLTGQRFGKVEVLQEVEPRIYKSGDKKTQFLCKCDCGRVFKTTSNRLRMGDVHSCGCSREKIRVGQKYGMFTVFEKVKIANGNTEWKCVCECGTIVQMPANRLLNRKNLHCGCQDSLVGQKFNKLLVIEPYGTKERPSGHSVKLWKCLCDCGNYTIVDTNSLKRNHTKSCGCLSTKHLMTKSRIHQIWCGMRKRCHDPNCIAYNNYGGRGISICKDWDDDQNGFVNFWNWSKESGYNEQLTLDRVDVNGDYGPDNCRWATKREQNRNRRNNIMITYCGETRCLMEWSEILNMNYGTLLSRVKRSGWSVEKAFETPIKNNKKRG